MDSNTNRPQKWPALSLLRRQKIEFFTMQAHSKPSTVYGAPGSASWYLAVVEFINSPGVTVRVIQHWVDKNPSLIETAKDSGPTHATRSRTCTPARQTEKFKEMMSNRRSKKSPSYEPSYPAAWYKYFDSHSSEERRSTPNAEEQRVPEESPAEPSGKKENAADELLMDVSSENANVVPEENAIVVAEENANVVPEENANVVPEENATDDIQMEVSSGNANVVSEENAADDLQMEVSSGNTNVVPEENSSDDSSSRAEDLLMEVDSTETVEPMSNSDSLDETPFSPEPEVRIIQDLVSNPEYGSQPESSTSNAIATLKADDEESQQVDNPTSILDLRVNSEEPFYFDQLRAAVGANNPELVLALVSELEELHGHIIDSLGEIIGLGGHLPNPQFQYL